MSTHLTVKSICDEVNNAAPFQKPAIEKSFEGIMVKWQGELREVDPNDSMTKDPSHPKVRVRLDTQRTFYSIMFTVPIEKYPEFKVLKRGSLVSVKGTIVKCSGAGLYVVLDVKEIVFQLAGRS
jgi:hypothetical protein